MNTEIIIPRLMPLKEPEQAQMQRLSRLRPFVRQSGNDQRQPWYLADRCLFDYLLVYIASGRGIFSLEDKVFPVKAGDIFWVPPATPHSMRGSSRIMNCLYTHFDLCYDPLRSHWNAMIPGGLTDLSAWPERMHPPIDDPQINSWRGLLDYHGNRLELLELFQRLCGEHRRCHGHPLHLSGLMLELLELLLWNTTGQSDDGYRHRLLNDAAVYIRTNAATIKSVVALASRFGFSASHFRRLFLQQHGISPMVLLQQCRLKQACELLAYSSCNISEIAARCGFNSIYNFSRAFKREMGMSPKEYRH